MKRRWYAGATGLVVGLLTLDVGPPTAAHASDPVIAGFRDFSFPSGTGGNSAATGEKPESKLWWNDGAWWAVLWNSAGSAYHVYQLDLPTQDWIDTGTAVDDRLNTKADALWDGTKLYVASHVFSQSGDPSPPGQHGELYRFDYDTTTRTYSLDPGFPVEINGAESETLVIEKDSTGTLWAVWVENQQVTINHTRNGDDTDWDVPFVLPAVDTANLTGDDIASIVAYDGHVGVMWSNQTTAQMYFAAHVDGDPELVWNSAIAFSISADDHINLKSVHADPTGRVFAVIKTSLASPLIVLVVCENTPSRCKSTRDWNFHVVYGSNTGRPTRPILLADTENRDLYVFTRNREAGENAIYYKRTSMDAVSFETGLGTAFIKSATETNINNATSTKQNLNSATGLTVLASDSTSLFYFHNYLVLNSSGGVPVVVSFSPSNGSPGAEISVFGLNFTGAFDTSFNGVPAAFTVDTDSQIRATVPAGATSGPISVSGPAGTGFSDADFTVGAGPVITSFDPTIGSVNAEVTITGFDFTGVTAVTFNGTPAAFVVDSDTQLRATVPAGATTGRIAVTNPAGTGFSATDFTVTGEQVVVTLMETANGTASITDVVTTSTGLIAADGHLYLASIAMKPAVAVSTVSGLGLAWSPVVVQCAGRNQTGVEMWMAQGQPTGNGTVSATLAAPPSNAVISVTRYSGVDTQSPIGAAGSANTNGADGACSGGSDAASYAFTISTVGNDSLVHGAVAMRNRDHTPGAGYIELDEIHAGSGGGEASVAVQTGAVPAPAPVSVDGSFSNTVDWAAAAVEILADTIPACVVDADCNDGLFCNGAETCATGGVCATGSSPSCDDGVACTDDVCSEASDACESSPNDLTCDNGLFCDGDERCDVVADCLPGLPPCDDLVDCTLDACEETTNLCVSVPDDLVCDDGDPCTVDVCDTASGCASSPIDCDDANACTADTCDAATGQCTSTPIDCDDANACTTDTCDAATGQCTGTPIDCDDANACTTDACDGATGQCVGTPVSCDDGDFCTTDACDAASGCANDPVDCSDGDLCTTDTCDVATGQCTSTPLTCDDADLCTTDACDTATGQCISTPIDCDDANACTTDACDGATGLCINTPAACDDGNLCTTDTCDAATGQCTSTPVTCDDADLCTTDSCDAATGQCTSTPIDCDDANACTTDTCDAASGQCASTPIDCDDGDACTSDTCDAAAGCVHVDTCAPTMVAFEDVKSGASSDSATVATATNVIAAVDQLYLASIASKRRRNVMDVEGLGLIWTRIGAQCSARNQTGVEVWAALGTPTGNGIVTATLSTSARNAVIAVARYSGVDITAPVGTIVSSNTNGTAGACSGGTDSDSYALDLATTVPNAVALAAVAMRQRTHTPGAGYTERIELIQGTSGRAASTAVEDRTIPLPVIALVDGSFNRQVDWAVVAVEIIPSSGTQCIIDTDCNDRAFCNGAEACVAGSCVAGTAPCAGQLCREADDACVDCLADADCNDGAFCNGAETCNAAGTCLAGADSCAGQLCREADDTCVDCLSNAACDDGDFCNGAETCNAAGTCAPGADPCPGLQCDEASDACVACTVDADCNDGAFCNGAETCVAGSCVAGTAPCAGQLCREADDACVDCLADADCNDTQICNGTEACSSAGNCVAGLPLDCDDGDACTLDTCDAQAGCLHEDTCGPSQVALAEVATGISVDAASVATDMALGAPAAAFYIAAVSFKPNSTVASVTGLGVSWTRALAQCSGRNQTGIEVWISDGQPTSSGTVIATLNSAPRNAAIAVARYSGADAVAPIGATASANTNGPGGGCSGGSDDASYSLSVSATEAGAAVYVAPAMRHRTHAPGAGFTEHAEIHAGDGGSAASVAAVDAPVDAPGAVLVQGSFSGDVDWAAIAFEILP